MKSFIKNLFIGKYNTQLLVLIGGVFMWYSAMVAFTIVGINERRAFHNDVQNLTPVVIEKETQYLELASAITIDTARSRGFIDAQVPLFIYVDAPAEALALR